MKRNAWMVNRRLWLLVLLLINPTVGSEGHLKCKEIVLTGRNVRDKIRVYDLCDSAMFHVLHNFALTSYKLESSAHGQRSNKLFN